MSDEIIEKIVQLSAVVNEMQRRQDNLIIPGKVIELSEDNKTVKVEHGSNKTPFIKWFAPAAGGVIEYRAPSIGEQCLLLNITGGRDTSACMALVGLSSDEFDFIDTNPSEHKRTYPDGSTVIYNHEVKKLTLDLSGEAVINTKGKTTVNSKGNTEVTAPKVFMNSDGTALDEALSRNTICAYTGSPHMSCGNTIFIGKP